MKTIENDMATMASMQATQRFTDAYLAGMPANKRRKVSSPRFLFRVTNKQAYLRIRVLFYIL